MKKILFFVLLFFSQLTFADTYTAIYGYICTGGYLIGGVNKPDQLHGAQCWHYPYSGSDWSNATLTYTCPGGGSLSGNQCFSAPSCSATQSRSTTTGICDAVPPHVCVIPEDPLTANCKFPTDQGLGINCVDGSTVYVPMVCPVSKWDTKTPPAPGQSATCADGRVIAYPVTCFDVFKQQAKGMFGLDKALAIVLNTMGGGLGGGPKPVLRVAGTLVDGLPSIRSVLPMEAKINKAGISAYASIDTSIPKITVGKAIAEYIKSAPTSTYATGLVAAAAAGVAATSLIINSNTGVVTSVGSTVPYSSNQLGDLALRTNSTNPVPLTDIAPFIDYGSIPWLEPATDAIEGDFTRVYDPAGQQAPLNFPNIVPGTSLISPTYDATKPSIVTIDETSPTTYLKPSPVAPSTLPSPNANTNPTATDTLTSPTATPSPTSSVDPNVPDAPPNAPTLYPDTWKYFDFLPMANPFMFDISKLLPTLPEPNCYYEIHRTFQVPYLGTKHFDIAPCLPLQPLRTVLNWAFAVLTGFICFYVVFRSSI